jgi:iron complex outermembrane receptor protein
MNLQRHPIAAAAALALLGALAPAQALAQAAAAAPAVPASAAPAKDDVQHVEVTGLRASLEASIAKKRNADSVVEVITADDIGKLPDKNVADALQAFRASTSPRRPAAKAASPRTIASPSAAPAPA